MSIIDVCPVCGRVVSQICEGCGCCEQCCNNDIVCDAAMEEAMEQDPCYDGWEDPMDEVQIKKEKLLLKKGDSENAC